MQLPSPGFLFSALIQVCRRFPGAILCAVLGAVACTALIDHENSSESADFFVRNWITCQLGLSYLTALVAYSESKGWSESRGWLLQLLGFAALVGCWFWLDTKAADFEYHILPQYFALVLVGHLAVAVAPYLNARSVRDFWDYNRQLFANLVVGAAFTLILFAGLSLAILAVDNLFNIAVNDKIYVKLYVLLAGVFNTAYFLFHFPQIYVAPNPSSAEEGGAYNWVFRNLCKFILLPIVILYFLILYTYGAKIGLQWSLPKGWVSSLVIGFSVAGIFTYLLNFYLEEEDKSLIVRGFKRYFWWVLLPLTGLLFVAIGTRISDYGVTEERYLVAQLGVWLAMTCLYFLFSKHDNLKFIPISLALFALIWAFGPLSAFAVSVRSQKGVAKEILARNGRMENGKMKSGTSVLTEPEREKVSSALDFLINHDEVTDLLPSPVDSALLVHSRLLNWLKIEAEGVQENRNLSISPENDHEPFDIKGFDQAYPIELSPGQALKPKLPGNYFSLSENGNMLQWHQWKDGKLSLVEMYSLVPILQKWGLKQNKAEINSYVSMSIQDRTITLSGRKNSLRLIVESADIELIKEEKQLNRLKGWLLIQAK